MHLLNLPNLTHPKLSLLAQEFGHFFGTLNRLNDLIYWRQRLEATQDAHVYAKSLCTSYSQ